MDYRCKPNKLQMVANPQILKKKKKNKQTKTQYSRLIHQVKKKPHQKPNLKKKTSLTINDNKQTARAPEHISHQWSGHKLELQSTSGIGDRRSVRSNRRLVMPRRAAQWRRPSVQSQASLLLQPQGISSFSLFSLLYIRVNGLMGMGFSLRLSISLSLSKDWKQMRVSLSLFETLSDCLALLYHFINICPCF